MMFFAAFILAGSHARTPPICAADLSTLRLEPMGLLQPPLRLEEHAVRPGLLHAQADLCRCLPRRVRHHPDSMIARLHIAPNAGTVRISYTIDAPAEAARATERMRHCLGAPTVTVPPVYYRSDMIVDGEPIDEEFVYPLRFNLIE